MINRVLPLSTEDFNYQLLNPGMSSVTLEPEEVIEGEITFTPTQVTCWYLFYFLDKEIFMAFVIEKLNDYPFGSFLKYVPGVR